MHVYLVILDLQKRPNFLRFLSRNKQAITIWQVYKLTTPVENGLKSGCEIFGKVYIHAAS